MTRAYPAYRDSGVEWLGEVPEEWEVVRLKHGCNVFPSNVDKHTVDGEIPVSLCNYTDVYYRERITADIEFMRASARPEEIEKFSLLVGDVIFTKDSETADDIGISALVTEELPGVVCGYHLSIARPREGVHGPYVKRFFDSRFAKASFEVSANGLTRVGLGQYAIDNVVFPLPPLSEQTAIAAFLDRETAKIDALVAEQRRLIDLLREKRQAVISHAVTKGLNPTAPLKPSGIDWLGDVPEGWEVLSLRRCSERVQTGSTPSSVSPELDQDDGFLWYTPGDFGNALDLLHSSRTVAFAAAEAGEIRVFPANSVLIVSIGATLGKVGITAHASSANQQINAVLPNAKIQPRFLAYSLLEKAAVMRFLSNASTIGIMNQEKTKDIILAVPPVAEQSDIVIHLDVMTAKLDTFTATAETAINLLQERRAALISAAVTGKIDVRHLALQATEAA